MVLHFWRPRPIVTAATPCLDATHTQIFAMDGEDMKEDVEKFRGELIEAVDLPSNTPCIRVVFFGPSS